jgi:4-hydroxy-tetrahydrodipicolinate reductase
VTRIAVVGARGRMGRTVVSLAAEQGMEVVAAIDAGERLSALSTSRAEVAIDFSSPGATTELAEVAAAAGIAIVSGTTGLGDEAHAALDRASTRIPVAWEPNMSVGVHVLGALVARAIAMLGPDFDIEVVETHHRLKVDAPSGTALRIAEIAREARGGARFVHGREGRPGARGAAEIGVHAVRGGDVVGDHAVSLFGAGERIELVHRASSRDLFASGALRFARWIAGKPPGRYGMADMLSSQAAFRT